VCDDAGQFFNVGFELVGDLEQRLAAQGRRDLLPADEGIFRGDHRAFDVLPGRARGVGDRLLRGRGFDRQRATIDTADPFAIQQLKGRSKAHGAVRLAH
jgi:hypothetical protein